jgi:hypothetical protein
METANEIFIKRVTVEMSDGSVEIHDGYVIVAAHNGEWDVQHTQDLNEDNVLDLAYDLVDAIETTRLYRGDQLLKTHNSENNEA